MGFGTKVLKIEVGYKEFENLVKNVYGIDYRFACDMETGNDTSVCIDVNGKVSDYDKISIKKWVESNGNDGNYMAHQLLNDLCANGHVEPGEHLIYVSW